MWKAEIWELEPRLKVATVMAQSREAVEREAAHYSLMYGQDGPVEVKIKRVTPTGKVDAAYNRAVHWQCRVELAQLWADWLMDGLSPAEHIIARR